jgi:phosphoenolpyruvate carboxylase
MPRQDISFSAKDAALREDVHVLGSLVGEVIREQGGEEFFEAVEGNRQAAIARREGDPEGALALVVRTRDVPPERANDLIRAFSTWFQMVNMAEKVHRIRRRRDYLNDANTPQPEGIEDAIARLKTQGVTLPEIRRLMLELWIEPVFTAHPIESTRRTILRKQQKIAALLLRRLSLSNSSSMDRHVLEQIRTEITSGWQTADNSRERLTVADEREHVLFFVVEVLYQIVPGFYEEVEDALLKVYGPEASSIELPEIIRFGSWVGGDMDGNPDVHAKTIRETVARHQQLIVNSYFLECQRLAEALSQSSMRVAVTARLKQRIESYTVLLSSVSGLTPARHDHMPYRVFLGQVAERLRATYEGRQNQYESATQFLEDINLIADSLRENKGKHAGLFQVRRLIRRIRTFGFHLATLDIRQGAAMHRTVVGQGFGDTKWLMRSSAERTARLREVLERDEGPSNQLDAAGKRTLWVLEALAHCRHRYGPDAIGPYVVSGALGADDILAVLALARWADIADRRSGDVPVDVAPLFESAETLEHCSDFIRNLFNEPVYRRHLLGRGNHQFVMIGYAASNQESGILTSRWLLHKAQEDLFAVAAEANIDITLIHGRSGIGGRSAARTEVFGRSAPQSARRGRLRITEQGELINEKYGLGPIAMRVFEQTFNALSIASSGGADQDDIAPIWRTAMETLAQHSLTAYRALVYGNPQFHDFFREVTPIDVIERMQIGSRPSSREERGSGIAALRTILWAQAWSQCRYMLPGWFGVGSALAAVSQESGAELLRAMYREWFFFQHLIDDVELSLARADLEIARFYEGLTSPQHAGCITAIREEHALARQHLLALKGSANLLDSEPVLQRSIRLRGPYIDPMHLLQVDLLRRWRAGGREDAKLASTLLASVNGIAQGLQGAG